MQLDAMAKAHPNQFKLWYTLDRPEDGWTYGKVRALLVHVIHVVATVL